MIMKNKRRMIYGAFAISNIPILLFFFVFGYNVIFIFIAYWLVFYSLIILFKINKLEDKIGQRHLEILLKFSENYWSNVIFSIKEIQELTYNGFPILDLKSYLIDLINPIEDPTKLILPLEKKSKIEINSFKKFILLLEDPFEKEFKFVEKTLYFKDIDMSINALVSKKKDKFAILEGINFDIPIIIKIDLSNELSLTDFKKNNIPDDFVKKLILSVQMVEERDEIISEYWTKILNLKK